MSENFKVEMKCEEGAKDSAKCKLSIESDDKKAECEMQIGDISKGDVFKVNCTGDPELLRKFKQPPI
jgi:hypothetical protein